MKKLFLLLFVVLLCGAAFGQTVVTGVEPNTIVKTITGQTGSITKVVWVTLPAGWYDIACSGYVSTAGTAANIDLAFYWTLPSNSESNFTPACRLAGAGGTAYGSGGVEHSGTIRVQVKGGGTVSYSTTTTSTGTYELKLTIKRVP